MLQNIMLVAMATGAIGTADEDFLLGQDTASGQDDVAAVNNATQVR